MLDIKPMYLKGLACYEGALVAIASNLNREYQLSYLNTFCFSYLKEDTEYIGDKIITTNDAFHEQIKLYCGIDMYPIETKNSIQETTNQFLDKRIPIGVETNAYYCPWSFEYQKSKYGHHYLIVGRDEKNYKCIDTTMYEKLYDIDYKNFLLGTNQITGFKYDDKVINFNYYDVLKKSINNILESDCLNDLNMFYNDFTNINYEKELSLFSDSHWGCALQRNIGFYIVGSIELYLEFIRYMDFKIDCFHFCMIIKNLQSLKDTWNSLYGVILKIYYTKDSTKYKDKSIKILEEIIKLYINIFDNLHEIKNTL